MPDQNSAKCRIKTQPNAGLKLSQMPEKVLNNLLQIKKK